MTGGQDTNSNAQAEPGEGLKDSAQNQASQISATSDALGDSSLEDVSGGTWPFSSTATAANSVYGKGG
ncbi:hypothetical protein ACVIW2_003353 [Bradyrhizobium huanghuaihaiense]|uniref:Uncharacterized protein n=1 Tax=Bradyrhizobium huanghuaihaiense TaxID=990078 RepID=A0A562R2N7_9BRAD|nr:hypothetical protein [Bradyrhizobium huanghuaihaiense]TWI63335.1 hypothetical protein IQ16_06394 [Bradyrhizobium huanghuaihaiense]